MAAADAAGKAAGDTAAKAGSFLTRKVGPLPLAVWLVAGVGIYWYFSRRQAAGSGSTAQGPGNQTDPAGNTGYIDPSTGYVYGSPEDTAGLQQAGQQSAGSGSGGSQNPSVGSTYADNGAWGRAAINYLAGLGVDATTANQAIQLYLTSQPLTTSQQGDVNLAIQALGPPPTLPGPVTGNPPPVTTPPGGGGTTPPPGSVTVPKVTGISATAAKAKLQSVGLVAGSEGKNGGTEIVNSQTPGAGTKVAKGSTVNLGLAKGTTTPPGGGGGGRKSVPAPTGLVVSAKSGHSVRVSWKRVNGATGYHLALAELGSSQRSNQDVGASAGTAVFSNLKANGKYAIDVWAEPEGGPKGSGPHASVSVQLPAR
jgi:hypothetical protein